MTSNEVQHGNIYTAWFAGRGRGAAHRTHPDRGRRGPAEADAAGHREQARDVHQAGDLHQGAARDVHGHLRPDREPGRDGQQDRRSRGERGGVHHPGHQRHQEGAGVPAEGQEEEDHDAALRHYWWKPRKLYAPQIF